MCCACISELAHTQPLYRYWFGVGARPSDTVARLLGQAGLIPRRVPRQSEQKGVKNPDKGKGR